MATPRKKTTLYILIAVILAVIVIGAILYVTIQPGTTTTPAPPKKMSFYTWWGGLERFAIDALIGNFTQKTGIEVEKTAVPGGGGVNARFAIAALLMAGTPPGAFQVHCGPELISYFNTAPRGINDFEDLTEIAKEIDAISTFTGELCMLSGRIYSLPVGLHRWNMIFMNKQVLDKYGIKPPSTLQELVSAAETLKRNGVPAMVQAGADLFTVFMLWGNIFLAVGGPSKAMEFFYGTIDPNDPAIIEATNIFLKLVDTFPSNWISLDWTGAVDQVVRGNGAFHVDGDWAVGLIYNVYPDVKMCPVTNITPDCNIIAAPFPGTSGIFVMTIDAVAVPKGLQAQLGLEFVKFFASREGQKIFNPLKGSIATYPDIPADIYPTSIQRWQVEEYRNAKVYLPDLGALFTDVWQKLLQYSVILAQTKNTDLWYNALREALASNRMQWEQSGYIMGSKEKPLAGYLPPWA